MSEDNIRSSLISPDLAGQRIDQALAALFPEATRAQWQLRIEDGRVTLNGSCPRKRDRVKSGDRVVVQILPPAQTSWKAEPIPLDVIHEDDDILIINKPPGLVVHPGAGNAAGTLLNALLNHNPELATLPRAGIVHRLDKDTSGLMVIAKHETARRDLIAQMQKRLVEREYLAVVRGVMVAGGTVDAPIGRHRIQRTRMAVSGRGKPAVSHYRVVKKYRAHTLVQVRLESGRTHQIRVHMAHLNFPVVGDPVYGGRLKIPAAAGERLKRSLRGFKRQALHALKLSLIHPQTGKRIRWAASVPQDFSQLMEALARDVTPGESK